MSSLTAPAVFQQTGTPSASIREVMKLPSIELPKFKGNVREWLPFWSQFRKIHDDLSVRREDKFQYMIQATVPDSRANELVNSFPPTAENYDKVITCLKNRFGRDDLVVEFYVRELLGLVLQNAVNNNKKTSVVALYDKVESYIRALGTLGVTTDKCAAMLYPLVESSLPEEVLRAWQRSGVREIADINGQQEPKDRLTKLLEFLQTEVENEERIDMTLTGFGLSAEQEKGKRNRGKNDFKDVATASVLFVSEENKVVNCIFCKSNHESRECEEAQKLNLSERSEVVKKKR
ncbi:uncharacterized protein LOC122502370 [Leptopilina heterotoma]|uniref:uncharacterized protein LOC122502370 n=1 Tax=Leptopilina heterotoma TaxID=63436 RepID=UPI001CA8FB8F|nr:uncharacterized protein LOC122502370 [Leptopilina heterotoma]